MIRRICSAAALCAAACMVCTKENPTSTASTIENLNVTGEVALCKIAGKVLQADSKASVSLEQGRPVFSASIDPTDGYFVFEEVPPGTYRFKITAQGYDTFATTIKIEPGYSYEFGNVLLAELSGESEDTVPSTYDHYPQDNAEMIYLPPDKYSEGSQRLFISVSFDRPMDRQSVEEALSIDPPVDGGYFVWFQNMRKFNYQQTQAQQPQYLWDGLYMENKVTLASTASLMLLDSTSVPGGSTPSAEITTYSVAKSFTFYFPKASCFTDTTYTIKIARTAVDTGGTPLDSTLEFTFKTIQSAITYSGIEMLPHNGDDWVSLLASKGIQITFPRRMNEESVGQNLSINVLSDPILLWRDYNHLTVYTGGIFVPETTYIITINAAAQDLDGEALGEDEILSFQTEPIRITQTSPARGELGVNKAATIVLTFNTNMDRTSFVPVAALKDADGDTVEGQFNNYGYRINNMNDSIYNLNQIIFDQSRDLKANTLHTLTIEPGAKDLNGYPMRNGYKLEFITMP
jgi:hypothetical protein